MTSSGIGADLAHPPLYQHGTTGVAETTSKLMENKPLEEIVLSDSAFDKQTQKLSLFELARHLKFRESTKIWTMEEIGFADQGISPNAISEAFSLFSEEAVMAMRAEVLSKDVMENCQYSSNMARCQLRGFAPQYAPFVFDVWKSPEVLGIVSKIGGVELVPVMDFEIGHINVSASSEREQEVAREALQDRAH